MIHIICSILLFSLTFFVHKHTYYKEDKWDKRVKGVRVKTPLWGVLLALVIAFIPIVQLVAFAVGLFFYLMGLATDEIYFHWDNKTFNKIIKLLSMDI